MRMGFHSTGRHRRGCLALFIATVVLAAQAASQPLHAAPLPSEAGEWSPVFNWPNAAIHMSLLPSGKVLSWATGETKYPGSNTATVVDIPAGGSLSGSVPANNTKSNLFCSGHTLLPDGRLLVTGGRSGPQSYGHPDINIFDAAGGNVWQTFGGFPKEYSRWYASALTLTNGEVLLLAGNRNGYKDPNTLPQVWLTTGGFRDLTKAVRKVNNYSKIFVAADGRVFVAGPEPTSLFLDTSGTGAWTTGPKHSFGNRADGTAAMYEDGKILVTAGGPSGVPSATAEIIDLNAPTPAWRLIDPMANPRRHANATLLPDGTVLVTGGSKSKEFNDAAGAILPAEMWNPATGKWSTMASLTIPRIYHSTALLLPDGRVIAAGGSKPLNSKFSSYKNAQIYSPPYLFKGSRPTIGSAPANLSYGQTFSVQTPDASTINKVRLIRLGSVTHSYNMNQRILTLSFTPGSGSLSVTVPPNHNLLPPGDYMLFILNGAGVPSVSKILNVG